MLYDDYSCLYVRKIANHEKNVKKGCLEGWFVQIGENRGEPNFKVVQRKKYKSYDQMVCTLGGAGSMYFKV